MNRWTKFALMILALVSVAIALPASDAFAQQKTLKEQLIGTWIYVSSTVTRPDGTKADRPDLKGILIYTREGHFAFLTIRPDVPKLASNDRARATADEARAVVAGALAFYGTYTVNEADKVIIPSIEGSTFANMIGGAEEKRMISSLTADELKFTNPRTPAGTVLEFVFKRAR